MKGQEEEKFLIELKNIMEKYDAEVIAFTWGCPGSIGMSLYIGRNCLWEYDGGSEVSFNADKLIEIIKRIKIKNSILNKN